MGEGNFGGNGSVRWNVSIREDVSFEPSIDDARDGSRRCGGIDKNHGT